MNITPTVGRVVHYHPGSADGMARGGQPLAAIVTYVHSDTCVNLTVFDSNGESYGRTSVLLAQPGANRPAANFCEWMPYQVGQAAKTEQLEKQIEAAK